MTHAIPPLAIISPFCNDGSPDGSSFRLSLNAERISWGLPIDQLRVLAHTPETISCTHHPSV